MVEQGIQREVRGRRRGRKDDEWMTLERWRGIMSSLTRRPAASAEMRYARYHTVSIQNDIPESLEVLVIMHGNSKGRKEQLQESI